MVQRMFLSYCDEDRVWCQRLHTDLCRHLGLARHGNVIYFAPRSNLPGDAWSPHLQAALTESPIFLIAISRAAAASSWVRVEAERALQLKRANPQRLIIPLLTTWDKSHLYAINRELENYQYADFREEGMYEQTLATLVYVLKRPQTLLESERTRIGATWIPLQKPTGIRAIESIGGFIKDMVMGE